MAFYSPVYQPVYYSNIPYPVYVYGVQPSVPFISQEIPYAVVSTTDTSSATLEQKITNYAMKTRQTEGKVLSQLQEEFQKFVLCFTYHNVTIPQDENENNIHAFQKEINFLWQSTDYLKTLNVSREEVSTEQELRASPRPKKKPKKSPTPQPVSGNYLPTQPRGILVDKDNYGNVVYKVDGKPIRFKVVKNRPKNGAFSSAWEWHYQKLVVFKNLYGHTNVTRSVEGYEDIGTWVAEQRRKIKKGRITWDQFEKLNIIGFEWDRSHYFYNTLHKKPKDDQVDQSFGTQPSEESMAQPNEATEEQIQPLEEGEDSDGHTDPEKVDDENNNQEDEQVSDAGMQAMMEDSTEARSQEAPDTAEQDA